MRTKKNLDQQRLSTKYLVIVAGSLTAIEECT